MTMEEMVSLSVLCAVDVLDEQCPRAREADARVEVAVDRIAAGDLAAAEELREALAVTTDSGRRIAAALGAHGLLTNSNGPMAERRDLNDWERRELLRELAVLVRRRP